MFIRCLQNLSKDRKYINGLLERSALCPALRQPERPSHSEGIEFDEAEESASIKNIINLNINTHELRLANKIHKYLWEIRIFTISVLQDRNYQLVRVNYSGLFTRNFRNIF
jgi:lysine-N-methylase